MLCNRAWKSNKTKFVHEMYKSLEPTLHNCIIVTVELETDVATGMRVLLSYVADITEYEYNRKMSPYPGEVKGAERQVGLRALLRVLLSVTEIMPLAQTKPGFSLPSHVW